MAAPLVHFGSALIITFALSGCKDRIDDCVVFAKIAAALAKEDTLKAADRAPHDLHKLGIKQLCAFLKRRNIPFIRAAGRANGSCCYDLVVGKEGMRVAVRAGEIRKRGGWVTRGRWQYFFQYDVGNFALHRCRHKKGQHADWFVCLPFFEVDADFANSIVLPWDEARLHTSVCAYISEDGYHGRYEEYVGGWENFR